MYKTWIKDGLSEYLREPHAVWHMPGHKRRACYGDVLDEIDAWDVTEVPGTDDLYLPEGFIKKSLGQLRDIYHTCGTYYVVNGATGGIFTAIAACTKPGDTILAARNCHKSVHNAAALLQRNCVYVKPVWHTEDFTDLLDGYVDASDVADLLQTHPEIRAVVVTSPTYEGVISDIGRIVQEAHKAGAYVIVDEAHGAHLPFLNPQQSAINMGADLIVQSLHKTLPAMTQTALLHVNRAELVARAESALAMLQTSSPSYIMMMSMESAVVHMARQDFSGYKAALAAFRRKMKKDTFSHIHLLSREDVEQAGSYAFDETRLTFLSDMAGPFMMQLLADEGNIVCEMAGTNDVVLISTVMDRESDFDHLFRTLKKVDAILSENVDRRDDNAGEMPDFSALTGSVAEAPVYVYPPGSYIVAKGEIFTEEIVQLLRKNWEAGLRIRGLQ